MNSYQKLHEPFIFWLAQNFLPSIKDHEEDVPPVDSREFWGTLIIIVAALIALKIIFNGI